MDGIQFFYTVHNCLLEIQPIFNNTFSLWCEYAFGMKLNAMNIIIFVLQTHYLSIVTHCSYIQTSREARTIYHPAVITPHRDALGQSCKYRIIAKLRSFC